MSGHDDVSARLKFLGLERRDCDRLQSIQTEIMAAIRPALDVFYGRVAITPDLTHFFSSSELRASAKTRQEQHWRSITNGDFGQEYLRSVTTIGDTHARLGLEPGWYIAGYAIVLDEMIKTIVKDAWPAQRRGFFSSKSEAVDGPEIGAKLGLVIRAALFDMDCAISAYLRNLEEDRQRARQAREDSLDALAAALTRVAQGDLLQSSYKDPNGDSGKLGDVFNDVISGLSTIIREVRGASEEIEIGANRITTASGDVLAKLQQQTTGPQSVCTTIGPLSDSVKAIAERAHGADTAVSKCEQDAIHTKEIVKETISAVEKISESCGRIGQIITMIEEIALQTNLLALNAGVEASRAGDAGKGFGVVAREVRALAQRSSHAAQETKALIAEVGRDVTHGVRLVNATGEALSGIAKSIVETGNLVGEIAISAGEQAKGVETINQSVRDLESDMKATLNMMQRTTQVSHALSGNSKTLANLVMNFRIH